MSLRLMFMFYRVRILQQTVLFGCSYIYSATGALFSSRSFVEWSSMQALLILTDADVDDPILSRGSLFCSDHNPLGLSPNASC